MLVFKGSNIASELRRTPWRFSTSAREVSDDVIKIGRSLNGAPDTQTHCAIVLHVSQKLNHSLGNVWLKYTTFKNTHKKAVHAVKVRYLNAFYLSILSVYLILFFIPLLTQ